MCILHLFFKIYIICFRGNGLVQYAARVKLSKNHFELFASNKVVPTKVIDFLESQIKLPLATNNSGNFDVSSENIDGQPTDILGGIFHIFRMHMHLI